MFCDSLFLCARGRGKVYTQMGKFLWSVLGIFSIIRLRIRGVKISGMTYIVRKHFRVVGDAEKIEIDGRYGGGGI